MNHSRSKFAAILGIGSVVLFVVSFVVFASLNSDFHLFHDYISKLGATGQPNDIWWNIIGFGFVGISLATFGWFFGLANKDIILGICFVVAGLGFAAASAPTDFESTDSALSRIHYASICFSLAGWCCGLARLTSKATTNSFARKSATFVVAASVLPMIAIPAEVSAEPIAHRVVLLTVFCWIIANSIELIRRDTPINQSQSLTES